MIGFNKTRCIFVLAVCLVAACDKDRDDPQSVATLSRFVEEKSQLDDALNAAAKYLVRMTGENGRMTYIYDPFTDQSHGGYNILRHAGTTYSLLQVYRHTGETEFLVAANRAMDYLLEQMHSCPGMSEALCVVENDVIKLGGNGLALVALAEFMNATGDLSLIPTAEKLALWISSSQQEDGSFRPHKWGFPEGEPTGFISGYYPGEAMLGLLRLYALSENPVWLDTVSNAANYLIHVRDGDKSDDQLSHDHWLMYALAELYPLDSRADFLQHAMRITDVIQQAQNLDPVAAGESPRWKGSFYKPPRIAPTSTRAEAMMGAWSLTLTEGGTQKEQAILETYCAAVSFLLSTQITGQVAYAGKFQPKSIGGFPKSLSAYRIRIDYVQHSISALLGLRNILESEEAASMTGACLY